MTRNRICQSPYPQSYVPTDLSLSQFLARTSPDDIHSSKLILDDFDDATQSKSYGRLWSAAARQAAGLRLSLELKPGDAACIYAYNAVNWASFTHSVLWLGGTKSALNPQAISCELLHYLGIAQPKVIAVDQEFELRVRGALKETKLRQEPRVVVLGRLRGATFGSLLKVVPQDFEGKEIKPHLPFDLSNQHNRRVPAMMVFSSGTATNPFVHNGHVQKVFYPSFTHIYRIVSSVLLPAWIGSYVVVMKQYDFLSYLKRCSGMKATVLRLVPATGVRQVKDPTAKSPDLGSVIIVMCSDAALSVEILHCREKPDKTRLVIDVQPGQNGECLVQGPTVFMHYKSNPTETKAALNGPWLQMGDVVRIDEDGFFWSTGRKKELIKYKGNQVASAELENVLPGNPLVSEARVCGIYDQVTDTEKPAGCIVRSSDERGIHNGTVLSHDFQLGSQTEQYTDLFYPHIETPIIEVLILDISKPHRFWNDISEFR
ncbi:acyl-CoA synthetases/AMP-acid ligases II [Xylariales sp. AK1849]|nr:acyl-CoA synthetases/AMP-acid ligases II [Xylariales sp. AK1849]